MRYLFLLIGLVACLPAAAVTAVNPTGVNVRSSGPSTAFLTFQNLDPNERAVEAFWCGELTGGATGGSVTTSDPCVPGTLFGRLPLRHDLSKQSASGSFTNLTDIMTIPASVARRAYQAAAAGQASDFFYVRHFTGGVGGDKFVAVTCRMAGGGARVPLALMDVRLVFKTPNGDAPVLALERGKTLPPFEARILYNGSGLLKGRWEVVMPGDPEPGDEDLLTEATLPVERRILQRRYQLLERFQVFLTPDGNSVTIPGPRTDLIPRLADGPHKILLRIEASDDKEADSNTNGGRIAHAGGVAGFPMPVLRFFIGGAEAIAALRETQIEKLGLFLPSDGAAAKRGDALTFSWIDTERAKLYRIEFAVDDQPVFSAVVPPGASSYTAPPWLVEQYVGKLLSWRVTAFGSDGSVTASSDWRSLKVP